MASPIKLENTPSNVLIDKDSAILLCKATESVALVAKDKSVSPIDRAKATIKAIGDFFTCFSQVSICLVNE